MTTWLSNLRKKPKHVRDNIALAAAGTCTVPVLLYTVFGVHAPKLAELETPKEDTKFFETFTSQVKEQLASVRGATSPEAVPDKFGLPPVIDRGPLDAVPVAPADTPVRTSSSSATSSTLKDSESPAL